MKSIKFIQLTESILFLRSIGFDFYRFKKCNHSSFYKIYKFYDGNDPNNYYYNCRYCDLYCSDCIFGLQINSKYDCMFAQLRKNGKYDYYPIKMVESVKLILDNYVDVKDELN